MWRHTPKTPLGSSVIPSRVFIHSRGLRAGDLSKDLTNIESMFDGSLPEIDELATLDDAALIDAAGGWARVENAACARKQAGMAEVFRARTGLEPPEDRDWWWVDPDAAVPAELAAAQRTSQGLALHQTYRGVALADRLPKIAAL